MSHSIDSISPLPNFSIIKLSPFHKFEDIFFLNSEKKSKFFIKKKHCKKIDLRNLIRQEQSKHIRVISFNPISKIILILDDLIAKFF